LKAFKKLSRESAEERIRELTSAFDKKQKETFSVIHVTVQIFREIVRLKKRSRIFLYQELAAIQDYSDLSETTLASFFTQHLAQYEEYKSVFKKIGEDMKSTLITYHPVHDLEVEFTRTLSWFLNQKEDYIALNHEIFLRDILKMDQTWIIKNET